MVEQLLHSQWTAANESILRMKVGSSLSPSDYEGKLLMGHRRKSDHVLVRIIKSLPAPLMDGFDVRGFELDRVYDVQNPIGRYLVVAGYAVPLNETVHDKPKRRKRKDPTK